MNKYKYPTGLILSTLMTLTPSCQALSTAPSSSPTVCMNELYLQVLTDYFPSENSFALAVLDNDNSWNEIWTFDDFEDKHVTYDFKKCYEPQCMKFTMLDSYGDGLEGEAGYELWWEGKMTAFAWSIRVVVS